MKIVTFVPIFFCVFAAVAEGNAACVDLWEGCTSTRIRGYCSRSQLDQLRNHYCKRTCGTCQTPKNRQKMDPYDKDSSRRPLLGEAQELFQFIANQNRPKTEPICEEFEAKLPIKSRRDVTRKILEFAWKMYKILLQTREFSSQNMVFSPASLAFGLDHLYEAASGTTREEIRRVIFDDIPQKDVRRAFGKINAYLSVPTRDPNLELRSKSVLLVHRGPLGVSVTNRFQAMILNCFKTAFIRRNIVANPERTRQLGNNLTSEATEGLVPEILPPGSVDSNSRILLLNSLYFKANWEKQFTEGETVRTRFQISRGRTQDVLMMTMKGTFPFSESGEFGGFKVLGLPYSGQKQTMWLFLPNDPHGLRQLERRLDAAAVLRILTTIPNVPVQIAIPKFNITTSAEISDQLKGLGLKEIFYRPDFSNMIPADSRGYNDAVSNIHHQAIIKVNEKGTEAAAATSISITALSAANVFYAGHPFMFLIRDNPTNTILFMGRVVNPAEAQGQR